METEYVKSKDGSRIAYTKEGQGPPLVLVDGALCYRRAGLAPILLPVLSQHFTVYVYDRRGRDESGDNKPYSIQKEIEDLKAVMDAAGGNPYVCAFSSGAALAIYAAAAGLAAKKMVLYEAPFLVVDETDLKIPDDCVEVLDKMIAENRRGDAVGYFMTRLIGVPGIFLLVMKLFMRKNWRNLINVAHTLPYDIRIMDQTKFQPPKETAAQIAVPTTVMYGEKTAAKLQKAAKALAGMIPNAELTALPKSSHVVKPDMLVPALINYFQQQEENNIIISHSQSK